MVSQSWVFRIVIEIAIKLAGLRRGEISKSEIEREIKSEIHAIRVLEESITKNITALVSGKITQETFLRKKEIINKTISQKIAGIEKLREKLRAITDGKDALEEKLAGLKPLVHIEKLNRELVDLLIDKILVHGEKDIEIIWRGEWGGDCLANENME